MNPSDPISHDSGDNFYPPFHLKNPYVQTMLASSRLRIWKQDPVNRSAEQRIFTTSDGIRLTGFHTSTGQIPAKGMVILIHGWEGSHRSAYIHSTARQLYRKGYAIFRLNLRDHGDSHHLNTGLFYATLIDEVFQVVEWICSWKPKQSVFLAGFSLGGNFALRIARKMQESPLGNIRHIIAVSPVLDPAKATDCIDRIGFIRRYFMGKWRRSLRRKQALYPQAYDFSEIFRLKTIREMTERLIPKYSPYESADEYFRGYSLLGTAIDRIDAPTTLIASRDDPIIPVEDFHALKASPSTRLLILHQGGHNGFLDGIFRPGWCERKMAQIFQKSS